MLNVLPFGKKAPNNNKNASIITERELWMQSPNISKESPKSDASYRKALNHPLALSNGILITTINLLYRAIALVPLGGRYRAVSSICRTSRGHRYIGQMPLRKYRS